MCAGGRRCTRSAALTASRPSSTAELRHTTSVPSALFTVFAASSPASTSSASSATNPRMSSTDSSPSERVPNAGSSRLRSERGEPCRRGGRRGRPRRALRRRRGPLPRTETSARDDGPRHPASAPPSRLGGSSRSRVRPSRCHGRQMDVLSGRICHATTGRPRSDGSNGPVQNTKKPRIPGLSQCAREDSNLHGPISPQGPQPCASTNSATGACAGQYSPGGARYPVSGKPLRVRSGPPGGFRRVPALSLSWGRATFTNTCSTCLDSPGPNEQGVDRWT
jgi:hypothetical protein